MRTEQPKCPKCRSAEFYAIKSIEYMLSLFSIGPTNEIIPTKGSLPFKAETSVYLYCDNCKWNGTTEDYWDEKSGIIRIFDGKEAL